MDNCGQLFPKVMQAYISGSLISFFFFQTLQHDRSQSVDKNNLTKISQKIYFQPTWQFWHNCVTIYIARFLQSIAA